MAKVDVEKIRRRLVKKKMRLAKKEGTNIIGEVSKRGITHGIAELLIHTAHLQLDLLTTGGLLIPTEWALKKTAQHALGYRDTIRVFGPDGSLYELKGKFKLTSKGAVPIKVSGRPKLVKTSKQVQKDLANEKLKEELKRYKEHIAQRREEEIVLRKQAAEQHKRFSIRALQAKRKGLKKRHGVSYI
jgi:hypothetical protein